MVILFNGEKTDKYPTDTTSLYQQYPQYRETAKQFLSQPSKEIDPPNLLYVQQNELGCTFENDKNIEIIGSDDATTCIIIILKQSGNVALVHCDGSHIQKLVNKMVEKIENLNRTQTNEVNSEEPIELLMFGGYKDEDGTGENIFGDIIQACHLIPVRINLTFACVGELNTTTKDGTAWPIIYGVAHNIRTGQFYPATFSDRGPDASLRSAKRFTGPSEFLDIYNCQDGLLTIGPFHYRPVYDADYYLKESDEFILRNLSTSPLVEPPHFAASMRATIQFIEDNPSDNFFDGPRLYKMGENGKWTRYIKSEESK